MTRVCCFCEKWASGGIEAFLSQTLSAMDRTDLQIDVAAARLDESVFTAGLEALGVGFYPLSGSPLRLGKNRRMLRRLLKENRYDVIHVNAYQALSLSLLGLARRAGVPVRIAHSHNTALRKSPLRPVKLALHRAARALFTREATSLLACSESAAEFLFDASALETQGWRLIPNGIDTARFRFRPEAREMTRRALGLADAFVVGHVGRLCSQKNQTFLLRAFARVLARRPESRLLLVGEGEERARLELEAQALGIQDAVIFYGVSDRVEELLWAMDAFTFPSLFEGLGIAAVEAQAAGLPVLVSEAVPPEAALTPLVQALPLEEEVWARAILEAAPEGREEAARAVQAAGYDLTDAAALLRAEFGKGSESGCPG